MGAQQVGLNAWDIFIISHMPIRLVCRNFGWSRKLIEYRINYTSQDITSGKPEDEKSSKMGVHNEGKLQALQNAYKNMFITIESFKR